MKFNYQARTKAGEIQSGIVEASSREAAVNVLKIHGVYVTFLGEVSPPFYARKIKHKINVSYPKDKSLTVDFLIKNYWIEFFGLSGELDAYDRLKERKLKIAKEEKLNLVALYPRDLFPETKLDIKLKFLL